MLGMNKIINLVPDNDDGFIQNIEELVEEYKKGNIRCMMLCFRRREEGSVRTYFLGRDDPFMFMTLVRLEHDILGLYEEDASFEEYGEE